MGGFYEECSVAKVLESTTWRFNIVPFLFVEGRIKADRGHCLLRGVGWACRLISFSFGSLPPGVEGSGVPSTGIVLCILIKLSFDTIPFTQFIYMIILMLSNYA